MLFWRTKHTSKQTGIFLADEDWSAFILPIIFNAEKTIVMKEKQLFQSNWKLSISVALFTAVKHDKHGHFSSFFINLFPNCFAILYIK